MPGQHGAAAILGTAARTVGSNFYLALSIRTLEQPRVFALGDFAFGDGYPVALVADAGSDCFVQFAGRHSSQVLTFGQPDVDSTDYKLGWIELAAPAKVSWVGPTVKDLVETFDFDTSWGRMISRTSIDVVSSPLSVNLQDTYDSQGTLFDPQGSQGLVGWDEWRGNEGRILAWRADETATVVATSSSWRPALFAVSDNRFVWLGVTGARASDGTYDSARIYSCNVARPLGACDVSEGPSIPATTTARLLVARGNRVAFTGCPASDCYHYVVNLDDSSVYRIPGTLAGDAQEVIGLSDTELFVADYGASVHPPDFDSLVRYALSALDSLGTRL